MTSVPTVPTPMDPISACAMRDTVAQESPAQVFAIHPKYFKRLLYAHNRGVASSLSHSP